MMKNDLKRRNKKVSPRNLKKHSDIMSQYNSNLKIPGNRVTTETGYRVEGFKGKSFEVFYEVMLKGTATDFLYHEKKDRTLWFISGDGFVSVDDKENGQIVRRIVPGDCVGLPRGTKYQISTTSNSQLEFFAAQSVKYEAALQTAEQTGSYKKATEEDLREPSMSERLGESPAPSRRPRTSKAAQQQILKSRGKKSPQVEAKENFVVREDAGSSDPRQFAFQQGKNAQPTGGKFDDEGAG